MLAGRELSAKVEVTLETTVAECVNIRPSPQWRRKRIPVNFWQTLLVRMRQDSIDSGCVS